MFYKMSICTKTYILIINHLNVMAEFISSVCVRMSLILSDFLLDFLAAFFLSDCLCPPSFPCLLFLSVFVLYLSFPSICLCHSVVVFPSV